MGRWRPDETYTDPSGEGRRPCARGEWCSGRTVTVENGERIVTPAWVYRPYCDLCAKHIGECAAGLGPLYARLGAAIGDPLQAEVQVHVPFGPQLPVREDIDAHMRLIASILPGWAARVRTLKDLVKPDPEARVDTAQAIAEDCRVLGLQHGPLLMLQDGWMTRTFRWPLDDDTTAWLADCEIVRMGQDSITVMTRVGGEDAGHEIQHLHYRARSVLGETNPPPELLITPCRNCTHRELRRAYPDPGGGRDLYSRCGRCGDEMDGAEYDTNTRRWVAYEKAQVVPILGAAS